MKKLISNIAIIIALVVTSVSYSNAQNHELKIYSSNNIWLNTVTLNVNGDLILVQTAVNPINTLNIFDSLSVYKYEYKPFGGTLITDTNIVFVEALYNGTNETILKLNIKFGSNTEYTMITFKIKTTVPSTASVKEVEVSNFSVYPNPVVDVLNIKFDAYEDVDVVVMDMSGRIVYNEPTSTMTTVNMSDQPSGMYLVKIGNQTQTFIKK